MTFRKLAATAAVLVLCLLSTLAFSQTTSNISGVVFADYYYNSKNSIAIEKDRNAFTFRRLYFTFENNITPDIKIRFRIDSENDKYGSATKLNPFVKHAFVEWSNLIPNHKLYWGIAETNAFKNSEELWAYRSVEKTIMDLNKISSSADMGIALKGDLLGNRLHHWLTVFNGPGCSSSEVDRYKKIGYALWITPVRGLMIEGYVDYENQDREVKSQTAALLSSAKDYTGSDSYNTMKGFLGYDHPRFSLGAEAFIRTNVNSGIRSVTTGYDSVKKEYKLSSSSPADVKRFGYSIFGSLITPIPKLKAFARYDFFDNNTKDLVYTKFDKATGKLTGGLNDEYTLLIAGFDYIPASNMHFMPNIMLKKYAVADLDSDLTARVTLYYKFDSGKIAGE
jgi:hypothetical protein